MQFWYSEFVVLLHKALGSLLVLENGPVGPPGTVISVFVIQTACFNNKT